MNDHLARRDSEVEMRVSYLKIKAFTFQKDLVSEATCGFLWKAV